MKIDTAWFVDIIKLSRFKSIRGLAIAMRLNQSSLSRMFSGLRQMRLAEAEEISRLLDQPLTEVLQRAGLNRLMVDDLVRALEFYGSGGLDKGERARRALKGWRA